MPYEWGRICLRHFQGGFTLLELLFVLFIVGLMVGLIAPRFGPRIDHMQLLSQRQDLEDQLRQLPRRVRLSGRNLELPKDLKMADLGDGAPVLKVPQGWGINFAPPLLIAANGACSAATLTMVFPAEEETPAKYSVSDLSCELSPLAP